jgi:hypothetical protein
MTTPVLRHQYGVWIDEAPFAHILTLVIFVANIVINQSTHTSIVNISVCVPSFNVYPAF